LLISDVREGLYCFVLPGEVHKVWVEAGDGGDSGDGGAHKMATVGFQSPVQQLRKTGNWTGTGPPRNQTMVVVA
jgi:hypothetical protein